MGMEKTDLLIGAQKADGIGKRDVGDAYLIAADDLEGAG